MELRHLRYFVVLAEELHFGRAAARLDIAPPTLTVQIQQIERTLGAKLFARTKRSVALTSPGVIFLVEARSVLARFAHAESVGRRAGRGEVGRIEIGYVGSAAYSGVLQRQISRFRAAAPGVDVNARELPMADVPIMLNEGLLDVGFVRLPMTLPSGLSRHVLMRDEFCIALSAEHPLAAGSGPIQSTQLPGEALIIPEQSAGSHEVMRRGMFDSEPAGSPGSLMAVLAQVSLGLGISVVPSVVAAVVRMPNVVFRALAGEPIASEVAAVFRSREPAPAAKKLIHQLMNSLPLQITFPPPV